MKNIFYTVLILFLTIGCKDENKSLVTISKEEYIKLKGETIKPEYPKYLMIGDHNTNNTNKTKFLIELGSDGHEYAHNVDGVYDGYVCFHYPDCKKCIKRDSL